MTRLRARWAALSGNLQGIILVAISGVLFAALNVATIFPAQELNSYMMAFCRYLFGGLFLLPIFWRKGFVEPFRTQRIGLHAIRGALHSSGMQLWFVALPLITLADITALGFTGPIFITLGAALFLGEDVRLRRWMAVMVGFIGAMLIVRPGFTEIGIGVLAALAATPLFSASNLMAKALARTDDADTIVIWQCIFIVLCAAPFAAVFWQTPTWEHIGWFLLAGLFGTVGHLVMQYGYQVAEISAVQPIGFLSLIWNTLFGFILFQQQPSTWTFIGAAVIFASAMYISHREAVRRAQVRTATAEAKP
ncbi:DMT family transporter [Vineibacter terrae]|uniref:DMT family transporter n=1 Tax=Vineibacter terrae TaxID=2586908 RepID=UPI002E318FA3|nr:DMT family transporter [Vineibacter terrae]HEX2885012.1 DMT family transporter [Vineibacter terrae]